MRVLLLSTYELGHQPLHLASPAAALLAAGHDVRAVDLALDPLEPSLLGWAEAVALSVPMHTAMRLAVEVAAGIRARRPQLPICLYGGYARVGEARTLGVVADRLVAGEYEPALLAWVDALERGAAEPGAVTELGRSPAHLPSRAGLPELDRYAHLEAFGERRIVGYVEASRGCRHRCRHCPVPTVYDGRFRVVPEEVVVADVARLVAMGAEHVTFGDPDFLNGPHHSRRVVRALHERFPGLTFDVTAKVELILRHADLWEELAAQGLLFVVSAFETTNDRILALLDKGHTVADEAAAVDRLRSCGVDVRPTWLPFTPWTSLEDLVDIVTFLDVHRLDVDPIQLSLRLLVPDGSLLLDVPDLLPYLDGYDPETLGWRWHAADPEVDALARRLAEIVARDPGRAPEETLAEMRREIFAAAGMGPPPPVTAAPGPRLTEPWFC